MKTLKNTIWTAVGLFGLAALIAMPSAADQVILDDLIVDGSLCVGFDCVNGESFGFDTIRLKENNVRIKFDDTSSTASFPDNDWQLTANDTTNGGLEKFSIDDIGRGRTPFTIEAGAPTNSLYVEDSGELGLGTNNPVACIHCKDGNTPTLRLEQDGSSGFTAQTWDVAGNEANFFIRDATNGSTLPFRIQPGAASNMLYIASDEQIGVGTTTPDQEFHVRSTDGGNVAIRLEGAGAGSNEWDFFVNDASNFFGVSYAAGTSGDPTGGKFEVDGDGQVRIIDRTHGLNAGTAACFGSNGELCECNSCS